MITVLLMQQTELAVRRRDADQHAARRSQRRHDGAVHFHVRCGAGLVFPEAYFVEHAGDQRPAAYGAEAIAMHGNDNAVP